ncbi:MAG: DUF3179 domain-containing (seleno)protein [Longimicrobiales bacterium]|nr:DUF3179 domain-containing (seleno)protein [Longimicrobiales bacterium]
MVCNSGVRMTPSVDGEIRWFSEHGLYDGLFLMRDRESGTFWDHLTGEAVYGPEVGTRLEVAPLRQTRVRQLIAEDSDAMIALSDRGGLRSDDQMKTEGLLRGVRGRLNRFFAGTIEEEDTRRPTMDLGLGVWGGERAVYFPYDVVVTTDNAILTEYDGRGILVYLDPTAQALTAIFTDADGVRWEDDVLHLSDGSRIEEGVVYDAAGERAEVERPLQVFTRWYGFSLTFDDVAIHGEEG